MLLLHADGRTEGTLGGGCVEAEVRQRALGLLKTGESALLAFDLDRDYGWDDGLICGGNMQVAVVSCHAPSDLPDLSEVLASMAHHEPAHLLLRVPAENRLVGFRIHLEPVPTVLIAGAGHVGTAVARLGVELGFRAVVVDDRPDLLTGDRLPPPIETATGDIAERLRDWPIDANTYVVIVTRGHRHDEQALQSVIRSPARYIGMIGSRRKTRLLFDDLAQLGIEPARLEQVHAPIGLSIGAITVPEIAVSIVAQLVQVRRADAVKAVEGPLDLQGAAS